MDIFELAAWAGIGSFIVAVVGIVVRIWRAKRFDKKKRLHK